MHTGKLLRLLLPTCLLLGAAAGPLPLGAEEASQVETLLREGEASLESGDLEAALRAFSEALKLDPDRSRTWNYLGGVHFLKGDYLKSLLNFKQAFALDPGDARACNNIGTAYERLDDPSKAEAFYLRAVEIDPSYAVPFRNLGVLYAEHLQRPKLARTYWERFLELRPTGPEAEAVREKLRSLAAED